MASWQAHLLNAITRLTIKPMMRFGSVHSMRAALLSMDARYANSLPPDVRIRSVVGAGYEGDRINIRGVRSRRVLLYLPGGAFVLRVPNQYKVFVAKICRAARAQALIVHYRLAPEHPFPAGLEDCLAAYHGLLDEGYEPGKISLAGDSAGGGLVLSTLLALRDEGSPMPGNAAVLSPLADLTYSGASRKRNRWRDPMLPTHRASQMHQIYIGDATPHDRYISPVLADFDGLPPLLGQVGSTEILLDDTVRAAVRARKAGVPFFLEIWDQMPHVFQALDVLPESAVAIARLARFINEGSLDPLPARYGGHAISAVV